MAMGPYQPCNRFGHVPILVRMATTRLPVPTHQAAYEHALAHDITCASVPLLPAHLLVPIVRIVHGKYEVQHRPLGPPRGRSTSGLSCSVELFC